MISETSQKIFSVTDYDFAATLASGERIEPGDSVGAPGGRMLTAERFEPAHSEAVAVDGDAILLR